MTPRDGVLLAAAVVATTLAAPLDHPISNEVDEAHWRNDGVVRRAAGDAAFFGGDGPFLLSGALLVVGSGNATLRRFAVHNMEAIALATAITGVVKGFAGRALPGVPTRHAFEFGRGFHDANGPFVAFPSGHTAAAFALAATIAGEVEHADSSRRRMIDLLAFGGAATVGVARVVQHVHWVSDLPLAAVIGTWSGRTIQRHAGDGGKLGAALRGVTVGPGVHRELRIGWLGHFGGPADAR
ncbi:MAG: phosphatase PAP2 family protein [Gemmatimonadales bacterium]